MELTFSGHPSSISTSNLNGSVTAVISHQDKNLPVGSPIYNFWLQTNVNGTWSASPQNLAIPLGEEENFGKEFVEVGGREDGTFQRKSFPGGGKAR